MAADEAVSRAARAEPTSTRRRSRRRARALDAIRAVVSELDIARATAEADLSHLAHTCEDAVHATLDEVVVEVEQLERDGQRDPGRRRVIAPTTDEDDDEDGRRDWQTWPTPRRATVVAAEQRDAERRGGDRARCARRSIASVRST